MSISASPPDSPADSPPPAQTAEDAPAQDGWRNGGLPALRAELDRIDNAIHDLLMQRAEVVEHVGRSGKPSAFRPGREASMLRRLLGRHRGALPPVTLVRIWREMLAGTTSMQGGFSLAVAEPVPGPATGPAPGPIPGAELSQLAREHFGALTPLRMHPSPAQALADLSQGRAAVAVLPYPSETETWWVSLLGHEPRLHIIACLPFWAPRPNGSAHARAVVVGTTPADASGHDRAFIGLACDPDISPARLAQELAGAGLKPESLLLPPTGSPTATGVAANAVAATALAEIDGFLAEDDARLSRPVLGPRRPVLLGHCALPVGAAPGAAP